MKDKIKQNQSAYNINSELIDEALQEINEETMLHAMDTVAPSSRQTDEEAHFQNTEHIKSCFSTLQPSVQQHTLFDFGQEIDCPSLNVSESVIPNKMADNDFYSLLQGFNLQKREFLCHATTNSFFSVRFWGCWGW